MSDFFPNPYFPVSYFGGPYFMGQQKEEEIPRTGGGWIIQFVWRPIEPIAPRVSMRDYVVKKIKKKPNKYQRKVSKKKRLEEPSIDFGRLGEIFQSRPPVALSPPAIDIPAQVVAEDINQDIELLILLAA